MTDGSGLREAAQAALTLIEDSLGRQIEPGYADMTVVARDLRAALSGESGEPTYETVLAAMVAHDEGTGESGEPKVCPRCGRWDSHDHAVPVGESDASLRDALTDWPKFSHGVRVRTVIDMENEGVVTWGDDRHRERFLADE